MLFTLGLVSVIALLIVGFVMTQGGTGAFTNQDGGIKTISLNPTPTTPIPVPTASSSQTISRGPSVDEIVALYEGKLKSQQEATAKQLEELRKKYDRQIVNLKTELQMMEAENKSLRDGE